MIQARPSIYRWSAAPQWLTHQAAWWVCILGSGWVRPSAMALFVSLHLWFTRSDWQRELRVIGWAVGLGLAADTLLVLSGAIAFEGGLRVGVVPLWMISLWAGFGATLLHSQRRMLKGRRLAIVLGALGGPLAYLGGERLNCLTVAGSFGLIAIGIAWAIVLGSLEAYLARLENFDEKVGVTE